MIHIFRVLGKCYLFDVESASFFEIDALLYDIIDTLGQDGTRELSEIEIKDCKDTVLQFLKKKTDGMLYRKYGEMALEAIQELQELKERGLIFTFAADEQPQKGEGIKSLCLHVCHDCNLSCEYCFASKGTYRGEREYMSLDVGKAAVDFLISESGKRVNLEIDFFGGEPLMNLNVVKGITAYARQKERILGKTFKLTLTTNGLMLDNAAAVFLNAEMENVVLSLDGRESVHNAIRKTINGKDSFELIVDNFKRFRAIRGEKSYYVRGTFTAENLDFSEDAVFIADLGFDQISVEPVVLPDGHRLALEEKHLPVLFEEYERLAALYLERKESAPFGFFHFNVDLDGGPCLKRRITGCGAGSEYFAVSPKGDLYPCHQFTGEDAYILGDVFSGIKNIDASETFKRSTVYTKPDCFACWAKYLCSGGCFANSVHYGGGINKPYKIGCALIKKRLECSLHIRNIVTG